MSCSHPAASGFLGESEMGMGDWGMVQLTHRGAPEGIPRRRISMPSLGVMAELSHRKVWSRWMIEWKRKVENKRSSIFLRCLRKCTVGEAETLPRRDRFPSKTEPYMTRCRRQCGRSISLLSSMSCALAQSICFSLMVSPPMVWKDLSTKKTSRSASIR